LDDLEIELAAVVSEHNAERISILAGIPAGVEQVFLDDTEDFVTGSTGLSDEKSISTGWHLAWVAKQI
jgi:hypothetical protein